MATPMEAAIQALYQQLDEQIKQVAEIKRHINELSVMAKLPAPFSDIEATATSMGTSNIQPDQFFGMGVSTAVKKYLKMKGRAAIVKEIYEALINGGFEFPSEWKQKEWLKNLAISISKNRYDFVRVPVGNDNAYGLWEFYPEKKREREKQKGSEPENNNTGEEVTTPEVKEVNETKKQ